MPIVTIPKMKVKSSRSLTLINSTLIRRPITFSSIPIRELISILQSKSFSHQKATENPPNQQLAVNRDVSVVQIIKEHHT